MLAYTKLVTLPQILCKGSDRGRVCPGQRNVLRSQAEEEVRKSVTYLPLWYQSWDAGSRYQYEELGGIDEHWIREGSTYMWAMPGPGLWWSMCLAFNAGFQRHGLTTPGLGNWIQYFMGRTVQISRTWRYKLQWQRKTRVQTFYSGLTTGTASPRGFSAILLRKLSHVQWMPASRLQLCMVGG